MTQEKAKMTDPEKGISISVVGDTYRILISGDDTGGDFSTIDMLIPPKGGPEAHSHSYFHESFFVLEGEIVVYSEGSQPYTAKKGAFVIIPKGGIVHSFKNESEKMAHILCYAVPAGVETFFEEIGEPVTWGEFKDPPEMTPEKQKELKKIAEKYGQKLYPPDFFKKK